MRKIDIDKWNRKKQYLFFKDYDDPYFNLCTTVDVSILKQFVKQKGHSFFLSCLFFLQDTANAIPEFRLRIKGSAVYDMLSVGIGSTVLQEDDTFAFCYFEQRNTLEEFHAHGRKRLSELMKSKKFEEAGDRLDLLYSSFLPWMRFTSVKHARNGAMETAGIPKFVIGKYYLEGGRWIMPISVEVHHALMDGLHVGRFLRTLQEKIDNLDITDNRS